MFYCADPTTGAAVWEEVVTSNVKSAIDFQGNTLSAYSEKIEVVTSSTDAVTLDLADANVFDVTIGTTDNTTISLDNVSTAGAPSFTMWLTQHADTPTVTFGFAPVFPDDSPPDIDEDTTYLMTFALQRSSTLWHGHLVGKDYGDGS